MPAIIKVVDGRTVISVNGAQSAYLAAQAGIQKAVDDLGGTFKGDKGDTGPANNTYTSLPAFKAQPVTNANATLMTSIGGVSYSWLTGDYSAITPDDDVYIKADDEALSVGVWKKEAALASTDQGGGAALVAFAPKSLTKSLRSVQDKLQEILTLPDYGGIGDGSAHTVQEWIIPGSHGRYADLSALQVDYPHVTATTNCANWAALLKAVKVAQDNSLGYVKLGAGVFVFTQQVALTGAGIAIIGVENPNIQTGSTRTASTVRWEGGATAMWKTTSTSWDFYGFGIENGTTATDWLEMASGSQRNTFYKIFAAGPNGTTRLGFTRSVIHSDGPRIGYGGMAFCVFSSIAPTIINLESGGATNTVTTFYMRHNQFSSPTQHLTALRVIGEGIEILDISNNTTIMFGFECTILDTTAIGIKNIYSLRVESNEFDVNPGAATDAAWRFLKLKNISNGKIANNQWYGGGGALTALVSLITSNVTENSGNYFYSIPGYMYEPDATSTIAPGHNVRNRTNAYGDYPPDWLGNILTPPVTGGTVLDLSKIPGEIKTAHLHPIGTGAYEIRCNSAPPLWVGAGTVLRVAIINDSGAAIHAGSFRPDHFIMAGGALTAPANGFQRIYSFYYNGSYFIETGRSAADVPIAPA